jgi:lipopolysaccharide biosynthesis glycosyltransferase
VETCLGIDRNAYFNAGVLLINCRYFREKDVLGEFCRLLNFYRFTVTQDEDYLNVICQGAVKLLPQGWNTEVYGEIETPREEMYVLHYIMASKPWHYENCRLGDIFWQYAAKTEAYADILADLRGYGEEQRQRDTVAAERLAALAASEIARPDHYLARLKAEKEKGKAPDRLNILKKIEQFERQGRFDEDVEDDPPSRTIEPGEVDYLCERWRSRMQCSLAFAAARGFVHRLMREKKMIIKEIRGSEHLAALQSGAVMTCNHFHAYDSFAAQLAYESGGFEGKRKFYRIIREGNYTSFPGFYGYLMRHCRTLPLSSNPKTMREFIHAVDTLLREGHIILIYPEQSMWWNYRKPKPLKEGGFHFAAKNGVPVIPCFITMTDSPYVGEDGFPVQEYTIHIGEAIYPDPSKRVSQNTQMMMEKNYAFWKDVYEMTYGVALEYTTIAN